jgi:O-antigen/teichoic acid export membrane protein
MNANEITGRLISRNWALSLFGQGLPIVIGILTVPWLLHYLGIEKFGVLSIAWALLGYVGQFDLGLGRATTKFAAECMGRSDNAKLPALVWTAVFCQVVFGLAAALLLLCLLPVVGNHIFKITASSPSEARAVWIVISCSLPVVIATNSLRGLLEAAQRFDVINWIRVPLNASIFLAPAVGVAFRLSLPWIVVLLALTRVAAALGFLIAILRSFPDLFQKFHLDKSLLRPLFTYGGWVTVSSILQPLIVYADRMLLGAILSLSAVGYYTAPYEIATKLWLVPTTLLATVFPAFASLHAAQSREQLDVVYAHSIKWIVLLTGPVLFLLAMFAESLFTAWLGADYAHRSAATLQILTVGVLVNCIGFVPFGLLQGLGRPDLTAKLHLLELPFYVVTLVLLVQRMGITGAAWAWTLRAAVDTLVLSIAVFRLKFISPGALIRGSVHRAAVILFLPVLLLPLSLMKLPLGFQAGATALVLAFLASLVWAYVLDGRERRLVVSVVKWF